jgi:LuxR family maltose regulon positive regulatory protein
MGSLASGHLAAEAMQYAEARQHYDEHLAASTEPLGGLALAAELGLIEVVHVTGVDEDALARLDVLRRQRRDVGDAVTTGWIDATECRLLLELGQLDAANRLVTQLPDLPTFEGVRAVVDLASGRLDEARLRLPDRPDAVPRYRLERALIEARAACKAGERAAPEVLAEIVRIGEAEGFVATVLRGGGSAVVEQMLGDPLLSGSPYLQGLRGMLEHRPVASVASGSLAGLIDPLSEREREVMRYLPTRLSCREIAGELYVSVNTVKTHVQAIYRKLGCNTRAAAVERARALHMLS